MAAFDFPPNAANPDPPSVGDTYKPDGSAITYRWNGNAWIAVAATTVDAVSLVTSGDGIATNPAGGITTSGSVSVDDTVVRTTGDQDIAGTKTFSDGIGISGGDAATVVSGLRKQGASIRTVVNSVDMVVASTSQTAFNGNVVIGNQGLDLTSGNGLLVKPDMVFSNTDASVVMVNPQTIEGTYNKLSLITARTQSDVAFTCEEYIGLEVQSPQAASNMTKADGTSTPLSGVKTSINGSTNLNIYAAGSAPSFFQGLIQADSGVNVTGGTIAPKTIVGTDNSIRIKGADPTEGYGEVNLGLTPMSDTGAHYAITAPKTVMMGLDRSYTFAQISLGQQATGNHSLAGFKINCQDVKVPGEIDNFYGFQINGSMNDSKALNNYGFYSAMAINSAGVRTDNQEISNYSFYGAGNAPNFFTGDTLVGGTAEGPNIALYANGTIKGNLLYQFSDSAGVPAAGSVERTVQQTLDQTVSVKDFGAAGDNTTDDTAAFQAAIDYCAPLNEKLYVPAGTYLITSTLVIPAGSGMELCGAGYGSELAMRPGASFTPNPIDSSFTDVFILLGGTGAVSYSPQIRDIFLSCPASLASRASVAIVTIRCSQARYENVQISGFANGIQMYANARSWFTKVGINSGLRDGTQANTAFLVSNVNNNQYNCTGLHFTDCEVFANGWTDEAAWVNAMLFESCDGAYIENSHFIQYENGHHSYLDTYHVLGAIRYSQCYFDRHFHYAVLVDSSSNAATDAKNNDLVFDSCYFRGNTTDTGNHIHISPDKTYALGQLKVVNSDFANTPGSSIFLAASSNTSRCIIANNYVRTSNQQGLNTGDCFTGGALNTIITGNIFDSSTNTTPGAAEAYTVYMANLNASDQVGANYNITGNQSTVRSSEATATGESTAFIRVAGMGANANRSGYVLENNSWSAI